MLYNIAGWLGAGFILLAYFLVSDKLLSPTSKRYHVLNMVGAALFIINTSHLKAWPSAVTNIIWISVAVYGLIRSKHHNKKTKRK